MTENEWLNHPAMQNMDSKKKEILILLIQNSKGKSLRQSLPLIMAANQELNKHNLSFSKQEQDLMFELLSEDLSPEDKDKAAKMRQLASQQNH